MNDDGILIGFVNVPKLNLRKEPSTEGEVIRELDESAVLEIEKLEDDLWLKVTTADDVTGFVMSEYVTITE